MNRHLLRYQQNLIEQMISMGLSSELAHDHQIDKAILDKFVNNMIILDNVSDTVFRVCDLIVVEVRKYGSEWREDCISFMLKEICDLIREVCNIYNNKLNRDDSMFQTTATNNNSNNKNAVDNTSKNV